MLVSIAKVADPRALQTALAGLTQALAPFAGRLAADADKPVAWDGPTPQRVVMILFDSPAQAQAWRDSDAFKAFEVELKRAASPSIQVIAGLPIAVGRGGRGRGFDQRAFEPFVKKDDALLGRLTGICTGC